jgi:ATP-binding cassette, subfamily B, bacterial
MDNPGVTFRDVMRFTRHYWGQNPGYLAGSVFFIVFCCVINNSIVPLYVGKITDGVAQAAYSGGVTDHAAIWFDFWIFAGASLAHGTLWAFAILFYNMFSANMQYCVAGDALFNVQRFSTDWHTNSFAGGTVRKITRGMGAFDVFSDRIIIGYFVIFVILSTAIFTLSIRIPLVALLMLVTTILYFGLSLYFSRRYLLPLFKQAAESDTQIGSTLADIMTGIPTIKSFAAEAREDELFHGVRLEWRTRALRAWQVARVIDTSRTIIRLVMLGGMVGLTIWLWEQGRATPGDIALVLTCFLAAQNAFRDMGTFISDVQKAYSEMADIVHFWHRQDDIRDTPGAAALTVAPGGGMIEFKNIAFQYKNTSAPVYQDLSVTIAAGERVALVGPSGSGKSTFVKLLQRLYDVQSGAVLIDGQNIAGVTQQSLRAHIALVPQDPVLFHRSLADNIAYGRPGATRDQIENAARQAFAHDFIMSFPQGYDTLVGERGVKLSGGERQRVAIARAILADTPILVMDEATSSLDSVSEHYIQQALENLMRGRTVITIAHRLATIRAATRILVFSGGQIIEQGAHAALIGNPQSMYKRLYDMQALGLVA